MTATDLRPLAPGERNPTLDALRGTALLGILLMNMEGFNGPVLASGSGLDPSLAGADRVVDALVYFFVQGKFFTLFSLLFGMGFMVMSQRAEEAGRGFAGLYLRRMAVLLCIGLAHGVLVWSGDILLAYALLGMPLLLVRNAPPLWLALPGVLLFLAGPGMVLLYALALAVSGPAMQAAIDKQMAPMVELVARASEVYAHGSWGEAVAVRAAEVAVNLSGLPIIGGLVLGMFLVGAALARSGALAAPERFPRLFALLRWGLMPLGVAVMAGSMAITPGASFGQFNARIGLAQALGLLAGGLMCMGYVGWLVALFRSRAGAGLARWLAPAGRMALTNYLLQSVVCTLVFYNYGLGYFGQMPRAWQAVFALVLFVLQVIFSHAWLARFRFGPMEWLWRSATYLRPQPMRLRAQPAAGRA
ncbi:DUF418 domain-containing protein [Pseudoxanthomonas suwonensis]|uniref:DUF418 domain-containing protein n=1 Tax=Pseudoxanthomonas suwonensis TaxID=314722 RepID=UPI001B881B69|nr:DUF418 domain-containing protein [Pseudoxanthomonas suwonensis]